MASQSDNKNMCLFFTFQTHEPRALNNNICILKSHQKHSCSACSKIEYDMIILTKYLHGSFTESNPFIFTGTPRSHSPRYTHSHLDATQYNHKWICRPLNSSTGAVRLKGPAHDQFSDGSEWGTTQPFTFPTQILPVCPLTFRPPLPLTLPPIQ